MRKQILLLSALFISVMVFGQKNEIKIAEKAIKSGDFDSAIQAISSAEALISGADQKTKAKFYYLKGKALYKNGSAGINFEEVGAAFNQLIQYEKETKKPKYTAEIGGLINNMVASIASKASSDYNLAVESKKPEDYESAAKGFEQVYLLSPADTAFLDNAALLYFFGKKHESSISAYERLMSLNYTGISTVFTATNKETGKDVVYNDKKSMDLQVKLGLAENPRQEVKESRRAVVFKNLAQNYSELGDNDKALEIIAKGRSEFPSSYALLIDEANIHFKNGDNAMFKEKLEQAIQLNPTEPSLYYNVGVMNMDQGNTDEAIKNFEKAIELKPDYGDAYNNIGAAMIEKAEPIIEEMNNSLSDFDKYDKLQAEQLAIYKKAVPFYEKAYEFNQSSISVVQTLLGLYENLEMTEKYDALKIVYDAIRE